MSCLLALMRVRVEVCNLASHYHHVVVKHLPSFYYVAFDRLTEAFHYSYRLNGAK